ncbi:MAG: hypothetical protein JST81_08865 [Bacteroidetes bacterium]|nr:hypothetical protein [Bacteroidota bacterium]
MRWLKAIKYNCLEAQQNGVRNQHEYIGPVKWIKLKYHLVFCKLCKKFLADAKKLDAVIEQHTNDLSHQPSFTLSPEEKDSIKKKLNP